MAYQQESVDLAKTPQAIFRRALHNELKTKRKVALRLGHLLDTAQWRLRPETLARLLRREISFDSLTDEHFTLDTGQKGVDMRLGLDIAAIAYKRLADQIVLVIGDSDFVPAAKLARREGLDVILDPLGLKLHEHLLEHTDGLRTPNYLVRQGKEARSFQVAWSLKRPWMLCPWNSAWTVRGSDTLKSGHDGSPFSDPA